MPYDYHYRRAEGYDYNRSGMVSQDELPRTASATRILDKNWDNRVSVWELADGFRRGDVKVRGGELRAWHESDSTYRPYHPSRPRYDDRPYRRHTTEGEDIVGGAIVGGLLGGLAGAILGGEDGAAVGAIIGGTAGAVSGVRK